MHLNERNQQVTQYAYHGTSSNNVPDILKHGLQPNRDETSYNGDDPNDMDASLKTIGGVYLTTLESVALHHAEHAVDVFGGQPVIVKVQYTMGSENLDEDDLYVWIRGEIATYPNPRGQFNLSYSEDEVVARMDSIRERDPYIKDEILDNFKDTFTVADNANLEPLWDIFTLLADGNFNPHVLLYRNAIDWVRVLYDESPSDWQTVRKLIHQVINITKRPIDPNQGNRSFRLTRPVGFKGKTKIVAISTPSAYGNKVFYQDREHTMTEDAEPSSDNEFWGDAGAGVLIIANDTKRILLPRRSEWVQEPHTWSTWGGGIDEGEDATTAAMREVEEEAGYEGEIIKLVHLYTFTSGSFRYDTFAAVIPTEFEPTLNWETDDTQWVEFGDWPSPLHFGLQEVLKDQSVMNKLGMLTTR